MNAPTVSVVIPTYNRAELLPRALDSVAAQTFGDWEIVLVDDGSTDETPAVVAQYAARLGRRLRCVRQNNAGSSAARNRGIEESRGTFLAFLDSDDEFLAPRLARQLELFSLRPELGLVYCDSAYVDLSGVQHDSVFNDKGPMARRVPCDGVAPGLYVARGSLFDWLIRGYFLSTIMGLVRREVLGSTIRFPEGRRYAEEWLFYLQVARACRAGFVDEPLCVHHFVPGSLSRSDPRRNTQERRELLRAVLATFPDLGGAARRIVHGHLADACRQMGFDARHAGDPGLAVRCFAESLCHRVSLRGLRDLAAALVDDPPVRRHPRAT
ncbi:MAG: glycosyltransferase family 2 protein [Planctomycetes bacterium]|nr:glycosyltransferase family 2 protein [Planctomycetota bacterium]